MLNNQTVQCVARLLANIKTKNNKQPGVSNSSRFQPWYWTGKVPKGKIIGTLHCTDISIIKSNHVLDLPLIES